MEKFFGKKKAARGGELDRVPRRVRMELKWKGDDLSIKKRPCLSIEAQNACEKWGPGEPNRRSRGGVGVSYEAARMQ